MEKLYSDILSMYSLINFFCKSLDIALLFVYNVIVYIFRFTEVIMKKVLVLYGTKYGSTKQYAEWIAGELDGDLKDVNKASCAQAKDYDVIILGGGLYAGGVKGIAFLIDNYERYKDKKWIVFTCGLADPLNNENVQAVRNNLYKKFSAGMRDEVKLFHLRGKIDYQQLTFIHKLMMSMLKKMIEKKKAEDLTDENRAFLDAYGKKCSFVKQDSIVPIIDYIKNA